MNMKNLRETIKTIIREESEYQQFFRKALEKAGKSITDMSDEEKKAFFNKIDAAWDGKGEKNEGNTFGAAVTKAKEQGKDEFEVGGKTYPVKETKINEISSGVLNKMKMKIDSLKSANVSQKDATDVISAIVKQNFKGGNVVKLSKAEDTLMDYFNGSTDWKWTSKKLNMISSPMFAANYDESVNEYDEWKNTRIQAKNIFRMLKQKYNNNISKMKDGLEDIIKQNKLKNDQADVVRGEFNKYFKLKESVNESKYNKDLDKIEAAVKNASSFMGVGAELKKAGIKYDFTTSMIPMYMIKVPGNTIAIVNKKYASGAEREVGDTAIGLLEGFIKATKKSVTESKFKKGDKLKHKTSNTGTFVVLDDSNGLKVKNLNTGRVFNNLLNKDEYEIVTESKFKKGDVVKLTGTQYKGKSGLIVSNDMTDGNYHVQIDGTIKGIKPNDLVKESVNENIQYSKEGYVKKMINAAGKMIKDITLDGNTFRYNPTYKTYNSVKNNELLHKSHFGIDEAKFKSGDKVTVKYPTLTKPLNGVVSTVLKGPDGDIVVLKGKNGVWDAKHVTLNEGNAFGMAVTKAKQEGKKEFEFNGKKYKVKKGSYEKNEASKKLAEKKK